MAGTCLFIIDPQKDFMPGGALGVPGADKDMERLAKVITSNRDSIDKIFITLDSHHSVHISHPIWWVDAEGNSPAPFTQIKKDDIIGENPKWKCKVPYFQQVTEDYITTLEDKGGMTHTIWPPHCIIGSEGHAVEDTLFAALLEWEKDFKIVEYIQKGETVFTEHFGAIQASVVMEQFEDTMINWPLIAALKECDRIIIAGEASSHCVAHTIAQMIQNMEAEHINKITYLKDACSPVPGFEALEEDLLKSLVKAGITIETTEGLEL